MSDADNQVSSFLSSFVARLRLEVSETAEAWLFCVDCAKLTSVDHDDDIVGAALLGRGVPCVHCGKTIDPWPVLLHSLMRPGPVASVPIGLRITSISYRLRRDAPKELDLVREGIPGDAQLLCVRHSVSPASCRIVDLDANVSPSHPRLQSNLLAVWLGVTTPPEDFQGRTTVLWAPQDADDVARQQLVEALNALANQRLRDAVMPAAIAVEYPLSRAVDEYYAWIATSNPRRITLPRGPSNFNHQLNVLAPAIASDIGAPRMPAYAQGPLNELRKLRNDVAHTGQAPKLTAEKAAEYVAASVYGFRYARLLCEFIAFLKQSGPVP